MKSRADAMDCTCECMCVLSGARRSRREGGDIIAGRGSVMWPSQGHCTEIIFIDCGNIEGTCAVRCTLQEVNSCCTEIITFFFFFFCSNQQTGNVLNLLSPDFDCFLDESVRL